MRTIVVLMMLALIGCDNNVAHENSVPGREEKSSTTNTKKGHETNRTEIVAVVINGRPITRNEICRDGKCELVLAMNKARKTKIGKGEFKAFERYCRTAVSREIGKAAIAEYVKEHKLVITPELLKQQSNIFAKKFGVRSKKLKRWHTVDDLKYMLGKNARRVDEDIMSMSRYVAMTNDIFAKDPVRVTDSMVTNRISEIARQNHDIALTNALIFAHATNVWRKIVAKELTFEEAATNYSEDAYIESGCEWGCFTMAQLSSETALLERLPKLKPGDITPPIESDGGLAIIRKDEDDGAATFTFSRVFFRLPVSWVEETPDEARNILLEDLTKRRIKDTMKEYSAKLKIEYPMGSNAVGRITVADLK